MAALQQAIADILNALDWNNKGVADGALRRIIKECGLCGAVQRLEAARRLDSDTKREVILGAAKMIKKIAAPKTTAYRLSTGLRVPVPFRASVLFKEDALYNALMNAVISVVNARWSGDPTEHSMVLSVFALRSNPMLMCKLVCKRGAEGSTHADA